MPYVWLGLVVVFLIIETQGISLVSLWFAVGALGAMIVAFCGGELWLQGAVFAGVSAVFFAGLRPFVKRYIRPNLTKTNIDSVIGAEGIVTQRVDNLTGNGQVKIGGMYWSARSTQAETIEEGTKIIVDRIEGVKVFVTPIPQESMIGG